jgi:uncharacterized membrane protein
VLSGGVAAAATCFAIALLTEVLGAEPGSGEMTDVGAVFEGLLDLTPWAWATLGVYAVLATPVIGLVATAWEYATISDRRTVLSAISVLAVLAVSAVIAILR